MDKQNGRPGHFRPILATPRPGQREIKQLTDEIDALLRQQLPPTAGTSPAEAPQPPHVLWEAPPETALRTPPADDPIQEEPAGNTPPTATAHMAAEMNTITQNASQAVAAHTPPEAPPASSPRPSVAIDALLADILGDTSPQQPDTPPEPPPDPEAEKRLAQKRRQQEFAQRQKQVEVSIIRERRRIKMTRERRLIEWLVVLLAALLVVFALTQFVFVNAEVPTESMEDTINTGDRVLGYRLAYLSDAPQRGEIIIFHYPDDERQLYVKRIAGLPGEVLEIVEGIVYVDGAAQPELNAHIKDAPQGNFGPYTVPQDCYFVLGDNRNRSWDSRYWKTTFVTFEQIVGKATHRFYPSINKLV